MPEKVLPEAEEFAKFCESLEKRGFRRLGRGEFGKDSVRLGLEAPFPRTGREVGYSFSANGLTVNVWTTFLAQEECARDQDAGWVLIKEGDTVLYFSHPLHRTKRFLYTLLGYACVARLRVLNRPLCPKCQARMDIAVGKGLKARYWRCQRPQAHGTSVNVSWDAGLPKEAMDFLRKLRKRRARYRAKLKKEGKTPGTAMLQRRGWRVTRPENAE